MTRNNDEAVDLRAASADDLKSMGLPPAFTFDELKGFLSEAELKALQDDEDPLFNAGDDADEAQAEAGNEDADADQPDDAGAADEEDGHAENDDVAEAGDDAGDAAANHGDENADQAAVDQRIPEAAAFVEAVSDGADPTITPVDVSQARAILDGAAAERKALLAKFDDGEMSEQEFDAALEQLTDKVADARADVRLAEQHATAQAEAYRSAWYSKTDKFMRDNPAFSDNAPVPGLGGASRLQLFDGALKRITSDPGYASLSMSDKINTAAKLAAGYFKQETGQDFVAKPAAKPADTPAPKTQAKAAAQPQQRRPDPGKRPAPVRTLGGVSTASVMEADDGRFAAIDRAGGVAAEQDFARMSKAEQDAYLRGA